MPSVSPGRCGRVVCDTDTSTRGSCSTSALISEVFPAPLGAEIISNCPRDGFTPYLLNILDLLAHLLYQHFKFDRHVGGAERCRF